MTRRSFNHIAYAAAGLIVCSITGSAYADPFSAELNGFEEVGGVGGGQTGAIFTAGTGNLALTVQSNTILYRLTYSGLSDVTQAHIHFGKTGVGGGIMAFLCTNLGNGPAGTQSCPTSAGTVSGTLNSASVVAIAAQNVTAGDFGALLAALDSNTAYVNVHTSKFTAGEIRGQIEHGNHDKK